jgi:transcriptional regulator of acetoin/glycerol metabolism
MSGRSPTIATDPAASTGRGELASGQPCIRWVYPAAATTRLDRTAHVVGRDESCGTSLQGHEISRHHAEVRIDGPLAVIRDLESRNGVYVNGRKVGHAPLDTGDVVRLGEWVGIVIRLGSGDDPTCRSLASGLLGSHRLAAVLEPARRVAPTDLPVVIQGGTGTGKEGVARALHDWSGRGGRFVAVNCAAIAPTLAEAELFGYRKGAFTGADRAGVGYLRAAHGGTLFLDEILDLAVPLQAKLLRVLEAQEVHPIGEPEPVSIDVRFVAATQEPLVRAASDGRFRPDLMARLDGLTVELPALGTRREDVAPLFLAFLRDKSGQAPPDLEPRLIEQLMLYDWPLNVRELSLLARRLLALHGSEGRLLRSHLPSRIVHAAVAESPAAGAPGTRSATDDEQAFDALVAALRTHGGNVTRAAAALGISRARAYRLLDARPDFKVDGLRPGERD